MDNDIKQLVRTLREIRLSEAERTRMRGRLEARMRQAPRPSPWSFLLLARMPMMAAALVLAVLGGGSALAEGSVPGDVLYPVKIGVTEPARSLIAFTQVDKIEWETERAERRLAEAELLAASGELDEETGEELSAQFEVALAKAEAGIEVLDDRQPDEAADVAAELAIALDSHSRILGEIAEAGTDVDIEGLRERIALRIETLRDKRLALRIALAHSAQAPEVGERTLAMVSDEAQEAIEEFTERRATFDTEAEVAIDTRVAHINAALDEGRANLALGSYDSALENFERARDLIGMGERLIRAKERLEGLDADVTYEAPAPVTMMMEATTTATSTASTTEEAPEADQEAEVFRATEAPEEDAAPLPLRIDLGL